jgi:hypothetical protein
MLMAAPVPKQAVPQKRAEDRLKELRDEYPRVTIQRIAEMYKSEVRKHIDDDDAS